MIYITRIYHRKDTSTDWYEQSSDYSEHLTKNYLKTKKLNKVTHQESEDGLSMITLSVFKDADAREEFNNDPMCKDHMSSREKYYLENGIIGEQAVILEK